MNKTCHSMTTWSNAYEAIKKYGITDLLKDVDVGETRVEINLYLSPIGSAYSGMAKDSVTR